MQLKTYELFISRIFHVIFSDWDWLWAWKLWIRGGCCNSSAASPQVNGEVGLCTRQWAPESISDCPASVLKSVSSFRLVRLGGIFFFFFLSANLYFSYASIKKTCIACLINKFVFFFLKVSDAVLGSRPHLTSSSLLCLSCLLRFPNQGLLLLLFGFAACYLDRKSVFWDSRNVDMPPLKPLKIWGRGTVLTLQHASF